MTHKIMSAVKSKDTRPELILRKALWRKNHRYRVNYKMLPGRPDIVFTKYRVVVFCDGDFWHGHNWALRGMSSLEEELDKYSDYWKNKILRNIERDRENNQALLALGWTVLRALALPRILAALLENNQTEQGILIPEVLQKYAGFSTID